MTLQNCEKGRGGGGKWELDEVYFLFFWRSISFFGGQQWDFLWNCTWASAQLFLSFKREGTSHPHTNTLGLTDVAGRNLNFIYKVGGF